MKKTEGYELFSKEWKLMREEDIYPSDELKYNFKDMKCAYQEASKGYVWIALALMAYGVFIGFLSAKN